MFFSQGRVAQLRLAQVLRLLRDKQGHGVAQLHLLQKLNGALAAHAYQAVPVHLRREEKEKEKKEKGG